MKRTDMVEHLSHFLPYSLFDGTERLEYADRLLKELENAGMKPPRLPDDHCQAIMSVYYGGYTFHQWEEDFKKDYDAASALQRRTNRLTPKQVVADDQEQTVTLSAGLGGKESFRKDSK